MDKESGLIFLLVLLLCDESCADQTSCPDKCQCFTPDQVLCTEGGMPYLPRNVSRKVKEFIIMSSDLQYLFSHTLVQSPHLTKLIFINNALRSVHSQAFEHLAELQELEISGNPRLEDLFKGTFAKQGNLTKLLLNFNSVTTVQPGTFDPLKRLETLQVKGNAISQLTTFLFLHLERLRVLDLSQNKIKGVERETFSGLERLEILKISYNLISNLTSDAFRDIPQLEELHLESNQMSELTGGVFGALTRLRVVNLRGNLLTAFSGKAFGCQASDLQELNLKGNRLTKLSSLTNLTSLSSLILASNRLSALPEDIFRNNTLLEYLDLSGNQLAALPGTIFHGLRGIKSIYLNENNLSELDANLFADQELMQQLHLSDNKLETLPRGLLDPFVIQHTVRLHGNPWKCDCRMSHLHDWVLRNSPDIEMLDRMLCDSPAFLKRRPVASIGGEQLVCRRPADETLDLNRCSQEAHNGAVIIKCKVDKCSPLTVKVQFLEDGGGVNEHALKSQPENSHCSNETLRESSANAWNK
ncbi:carboxypeptidase N subunit 2 [Brachionichthys hirsutus]|uniref:carboxypeptidase N subunit 2 n=1 Tax=Brachionichthys hirsutus TaxID=412623 RepID=UPI0036047CFA